MDQKHILTSWTFWFNIVSVALTVIQMPEVLALNIIPQTWMPIIIVIGNIVLRLKTDTGVIVLPKK